MVNSMDVCLIAAGTQLIGDRQQVTALPQHQVSLPAFAMATAAVSNAAFAAFISAGAYRQPEFWTEMGLRWLRNKEGIYPPFWSNAAFNAPDQPVVGVTWYEACAYAAWLSRETGLPWRLPSEPEWEAAARSGPADAPPVRIQSAESRFPRPLPVYVEGYLSPCGACHLLGNVYEWCSTRWGRNWQSLDYPYPWTATDGREDLSGSNARVMRGGSWFDGAMAATPSYRARYLPGSRGSNIGFRLVYSLS